MPDLSAVEIRQRNRELYRQEQDLPKVKWAAFQEQRRREELAALRFTEKQQGLQHKLKTMRPEIQNFIIKLRKCLGTLMKEGGGTEVSIMRTAFLNWDSRNTGLLAPEEFTGALRSLGLVISQREAAAVVSYYSTDSVKQGMSYQPLVEDLSRGARHFLHHPDVPSARGLSDPAERYISESSRPAKRDAASDPFIAAYLRKLRKKLWAEMRKNGDYEKMIIRRAFLNWDRDASGELNPDELRGAMHQLGMHVNESEAIRIVKFYDRSGRGEMTYSDLVEDVSNGIPTFMAHPESEGKCTLDQVDAEDRQVGGRMFTARATARSENAVVEKFKVKMRKTLEATTRKIGGTISSILREAFLFWDGDNSGLLDPRELRGAIQRAGLKISMAEAQQIVAFYDRTGKGEIQYHELVKDVAQGTHDIISHDTSRSSARPQTFTARVPSEVSQVLTGIKAAVERCAAKSAMSVRAVDLLHGTLLRYDATNTGKLSGTELSKALRELKADVDPNAMGRLVNWYDEDATRTIAYKKFVRDTFGAATYSASNQLSSTRSSQGGGATHRHMKKKAILAEKARIEKRLSELTAASSKGALAVPGSGRIALSSSRKLM